MATVVFDTIVVFNSEEVLALIPGKGRGLLAHLQDHSIWETVLEEIGIELLDEVKSIEELVDLFKRDTYSINLSLIENTTYKTR